MVDTIRPIVSLILAVVLYCGLPAAMVWGWVRWIRGKQARTVSSVLSLLGLAFATTSALLVGASVWYGRSIGFDFSLRESLPLALMDWAGACLSLAATAAAVGGLRRPNLVRWHSLLVALGMLVLWMADRIQMVAGGYPPN
jgi:hypothetical protein